VSKVVILSLSYVLFLFHSVFFALFFGILSASQASTFVPNYAKARLSAKRIFALEDLVPAIDSYSEEGEKLVSVPCAHISAKEW